ncbi:anion permease, partial [bacterium]|nr:anion permease [bacterium]
MGKRIKHSVFIFSLIIAIMAVILPTPAGLSRPAQNCLAVFVLCIALWVTALIPISITGLLAIVLLPALKVIDSRTAFSLFGSSPVFFILGVFIMAAALMKTGLSSRMALFFLTKFDRGPRSLIAGILLSSAFLSFWMPEHAVAAMMLPIVLEIARALKLEPIVSDYGKALFLSLAWGAIIGGVGTLLGGARNPLAIGILQQTFDMNITFLQWVIAAVPIVFVLLIIALPYILLTF